MALRGVDVGGTSVGVGDLPRGAFQRSEPAACLGPWVVYPERCQITPEPSRSVSVPARYVSVPADRSGNGGLPDPGQVTDEQIDVEVELISHDSSHAGIE